MVMHHPFPDLSVDVPDLSASMARFSEVEGDRAVTPVEAGPREDLQMPSRLERRLHELRCATLMRDCHTLGFRHTSGISAAQPSNNHSMSAGAISQPEAEALRRSLTKRHLSLKAERDTLSMQIGRHEENLNLLCSRDIVPKGSSEERQSVYEIIAARLKESEQRHAMLSAAVSSAESSIRAAALNFAQNIAAHHT
jgi:hypothetical protein